MLPQYLILTLTINSSLSFHESVSVSLEVAPDTGPTADASSQHDGDFDVDLVQICTIHYSLARSHCHIGF